jgi:hypothetical protein
VNVLIVSADLNMSKKNRLCTTMTMNRLRNYLNNKNNMPTASDVLPEVGMSIKNFFRAVMYPLKDIAQMRVGNMCIMILMLLIVIGLLITWLKDEFTWKGFVISACTLYVGSTLGYNMCLNDAESGKHEKKTKQVTEED